MKYDASNVCAEQLLSSIQICMPLCSQGGHPQGHPITAPRHAVPKLDGEGAPYGKLKQAHVVLGLSTTLIAISG